MTARPADSPLANVVGLSTATSRPPSHQRALSPPTPPPRPADRPQLMRYRVLAPAEAGATIPRGAAVLEYRHRAHGAAHGLVYAGRDQFAELCAQAARQGRLVALPDDCQEVGYYDADDGELRAHNRGIAALERWLGRRVNRGDLEARENRSSSRARARRLTFEGRFAEAAKLDRRCGF